MKYLGKEPIYWKPGDQESYGKSWDSIFKKGDPNDGKDGNEKAGVGQES
jgi:hypothetical protein